MICPKCNITDNATDAVFCHNCGTKFSRKKSHKGCILITVILIIIAAITGFIICIDGTNNYSSTSQNDSANTYTSGDNDIIALGTVNEIFPDEHKIKKIIQNYNQYIIDNNFQGFRNLYAPVVKRFHDAYNKDKEYIISLHENYDSRYNVYGKLSSVRWNTLEISKQSNKLVSVQFIQDYSIDSDNPRIYKSFVLEKHIELNENYQIVSVYDIQVSRSK